MTDLEKLVSAYRLWAGNRDLPPGTAVVQVDRVAAKVAAFYEKIRGIVDWSEEHLLRKTAIARILRRRILLRDSDQSLAEAFLQDLVRGGYFPNGRIPEAKIPAIDLVLKKYLFLLDVVRLRSPREVRLLTDWLLGIAGCEVEAVLDPPIREEALLEFMTNQLDRRIVIRRPLPERERENLIFVAVRQALFKLDRPIISYQLIKKYVPAWESLRVDADREALERFASDLPRWYENAERAFRHSLAEKFYWAAEMADAPYLVLGDVLSESALAGELSLEMLTDAHLLESRAFIAYKRRAQTERRRATRAAIYSTLSIFISKILIAFAVEVPIDRLTDSFSYQTLALNIGIPPLLMMAIILWGLQPPPKGNAAKVMTGVSNIIRGELPEYEIRIPQKHSWFMRAAIGLLYAIGTAITFGLIIIALTKLEFSAASQAIFIFFVSLIAFAGLRIRERSKELVIEESSSGILQDIVAFFTLPIVELGRWSSRQLLRIRLVAILLDILIELPLQFFIQFIEQWRSFLKEKKQGIH